MFERFLGFRVVGFFQFFQIYTSRDLGLLLLFLSCRHFGFEGMGISEL